MAMVASRGEKSQPLKAPEKRRPWRKVLEDPRPKLPAPPPSLREAPLGASEARRQRVNRKARRRSGRKVPGRRRRLVRRMEAKGQGECGSKDSQYGFRHRRL